jgi:signal transduction histidine kinase
MNALRLVALLTYTFGAFAYGAFLVLWVRELGRAGWGGRSSDRSAASQEMDAINGALLVVSFLWFCSNVGLALLGFMTRRTPWQLEVATICFAFAFPPLIVHVTLTEVVHSRNAPVASGWRAALWPAYAAALILPLWSLVLLARPASASSQYVAEMLLRFGLPAMFVCAAVYSIAILTRHSTTAEPRARLARRWTVGLLSLMVLLFLMLVGITRSSGGPRPAVAAAAILEIAVKSMPLLFMFVGTYFENRFQFFDMLVKRGVSLLATVGILTTWFAITQPLLQRLDTSWAAPWIYAVCLLPVAAALPWIHGRIGAILDLRWLGRRFATVDAVKHFLSGLRSATTEAQLVERAQAGLEEIFGAPVTVVIGPTSGSTSQAAQEIPIRSGGVTIGRFLMGPRASEAPYFSEDVALLMSLADVFSHVLENLHLQERRLEQEHRAQELSLHASRSELKALRAQINPHFLFNALNSIAGLIHRDPAVADRTIEQLADVFRYALRGAESEWAVLDDELDFVRAYLEVERARFGDRLMTDVRIDDAVRGARVPTMMVQTLVENAVKHGAASVRGHASVVVTAREESGQLVMSVADNGPGFSLDSRDNPLAQGRRAGGGYGLVNIRQRLEGYFGSEAALSVKRADGVTIVSVALPLLRQEPRAQQPREIAR